MVKHTSNLTVTYAFLTAQQRDVPITGDNIFVRHSKGIAVFDDISKLRVVR